MSVFHLHKNHMEERMSKKIYDIIKKQNGEAFAKGIREFDNGIFDVPNLPYIVKFAGRNVLPLLTFLESLKKINIINTKRGLNPLALLDLAGYDAYVADTFEKQNSIQKYFEYEEELCTFKDPKRYKYYHIINAVKKNVHEIKRDAFYGKERREDEYGTSVISIQILKKGGFISIKNRYNHTVEACDNTFNSNPDNIIMGLSNALRNFFNVDFSAREVPIPCGYTFQNGQIIQYELEKNNTYFGKDFYLKDGRIVQINKDYQLMIMPFIIDLKERKVFNPAGVIDGIKDVLEAEIQKGSLQVLNQNGMKVLMQGKKAVLYVHEGMLKRLCLQNLVEMPTNSLKHFKGLEEVDAPNLKVINEWCFENLKNLKKVNLPSLETLYSFSFKGTDADVYAPKMQEKGIYFFGSLAIDIKNKEIKTKGGYHSEFCTFLQSIILNNTVSVKQYLDGICELMINEEPFFKFKNGKLVKIALGKITQLDAGVIHNLTDLEEVHLPNVSYVWSGNFNECPKLKKIFLPKVTEIGSNVFCECESLEEIDCPKVRYLEWQCVNDNPNLKKVSMPKLEKTKDYCFNHNGLEELHLPLLEKVKSNCFCHLPRLKKLNLPCLESTKERCFCFLDEIKELTLDSLKSYWGDCYMSNNPKLKRICLPNLEIVRSQTFLNCKELETLILRKAEFILDNVLNEMPALKNVIAPNVTFVGDNILSNCPHLTLVYIPRLVLLKQTVGTNSPCLKCFYAPNVEIKEAEEEKAPFSVVVRKMTIEIKNKIQHVVFQR